MGSVYLAHDTQLDREVSLKIPHIPPGSAPEVLARFYREARAAAALDHPNLCPVHDVGEIDGTPYLTMAYIDGRPLSQLIGRADPLPQRQVAAVIRKLALALQEAHDRGVVHRDLKPANVLVSRKRDLVIVDFGLARRDDGDARLTQSGMILGTPAYMAPERVAGEMGTAGPASDIYALGVILYEMLTGRVPFEGSVALVLGRIIAAEPESVRAFRPDVEPRLEAICRKAMAKEPSLRYGSMREFATALWEYLRSAGEPGVPLGELPPSIPVAGLPPSARTGSETLIGRLVDRFGSRDVAEPLPIRLDDPPDPVAARGKPRPPSRRALAFAAAVLALTSMMSYLVMGYGKLKPQLSSPIAAQTALKTRPDPPTPAASPLETGLALGQQFRPMGSITNSVGMTLKRIPAGEFLMGSPETDPDAEADEKPQHRVRIGAFHMGVTEVTRWQFRRFVEQTGYRTAAEDDGKGFGWNEKVGGFVIDPRYSWRDTGFPQNDEHPVVNVTWNDAVAFCRWLSRAEGRMYRLPTEAEWEYACRAGTTTRYSNGDDPEGLAAVANTMDWGANQPTPGVYRDVTSLRDGFVFSAPVGKFRPNGFGLYDMHGNVWELCQDGYDAGYYGRSPVDDPPGPSVAPFQVLRGGGWRSLPNRIRSAFRKRALTPRVVSPDDRENDIGFRVVRPQSGS
jgi:formylglycine-generating enzyme required for sulfatase activity/serine/threonine protein kinase